MSTAAILAAIRPFVAMTFDEARQAAADVGARLIYCRCDPTDPCWLPAMPITTPLMRRDGHQACDACTLRAAITEAATAESLTHLLAGD